MLRASVISFFMNEVPEDPKKVSGSTSEIAIKVQDESAIEY